MIHWWGLLGLFVNGCDVGIHKQEQISDLLSQGLIDHATVMVGDRDFDIQAAKSNGLRSAAVLWGYGTLDELQRSSPDYICADLLNLNDASCAISKRGCGDRRIVIGST